MTPQEAVAIYTYSGRRHITLQPDFTPESKWDVGFYPAACSSIIWGKKEPVHGEDPSSMKSCVRCSAKQVSA